MSKTSADCQLALMRNEACQRGPIVLLRSLSQAALVTIHESAGMVPDTPRELSSSCARKELIKVTGRSVGRSVGATCIFFTSSLPPPSLSFSLSLSTNPKRLDPIQCSAKVLCNRSSSSRLGMFLPPVSVSQRQADPPPSILAMLVRDEATLA